MRKAIGKGTVIALGLAIALGVMYFVILEDLIVSLAVGLSALLVYLFLFLTVFRKYASRREKEHEDYRFIFSFVASLSTTGSLETAYNTALEGAGEELLAIASGLEDRRIEERISYLASYFGSDTYQMFVSLFSLYQEQGGDFLKMASPLLNESSRAEEENNRKEMTGKRTLREFCLLWGMACLIMLTLRFALSGFYDDLQSLLSYRLSSLLFLPILYVSSFMFASAMTGESPFRRKSHE